ncbi:MAG: hypothetical protein GIW95_07290 [Candidatus Eremiobacteraeota bacterium]|nr:hypothetical protein [Candidatus Eremiobacteraeota bacterium]
MVALVLAAALLAQGGAMSGPCSGADPAIASVTSSLLGNVGSVNRYRLAVTVQNRGSKKQSSNVLQSVVMFQNAWKTDTKGIPPLRPGQSYTANFTFQRSAEADEHSTRFRFEIQFRQPNPPGSMDCNLGNDTYRLEV